MKILFTTDELDNYFVKKIKHSLYNETIELSKELSQHAEGLFPDELIKSRRPSEIDKVQQYREKIFQAITYPVLSKVLTAIRKIRRSPDWRIRFDESAFSSKISPNESPKAYLTENYPQFGSLENWLFELCLQVYIVDANAVVLVLPAEIIVPENEYLKPYTHVFRSENVIDFVDNDYAILRKDEDVVKIENNVSVTYEAYYIVTTQDIAYYEVHKDKYNLVWSYNHRIGEMPAFKVKGLVKKTTGKSILFKSKIDAMRPRLNEAIREYSDLQAEVVQNIFSERWELSSNDCGTCKGDGYLKVAGFGKQTIECHHCKGTGSEPRGPYSIITVKAGMAGEPGIPTPPAGIIEKDTEMVKIQDERIDKHIWHALSAINMEFLAETPLAESGVAKSYDREEINSFIHSIAIDLVNIYMLSAYFIGEFRYNDVLPNIKERFDHLPIVVVPEQLDLLSASHYEEEISKAKTDKMNPAIIIEMEKQYINKRFSGDDNAKRKIMMILELDPLAGLTEEDKIMRVESSGIRRVDYVISSNITRFIQRAEKEKGDQFYRLDKEQQLELFEQYANELIPPTKPVPALPEL